MEIKEINPQAAGSVHWKFWYLWSNRCLLLAWPWSTPLNWHIIPFLLPIFFFSLLLDWKGRDNLGLERAVRPGTLLIHLHTGQACWGQPLLDIFAIMAKICRTEMFTCKKNHDRFLQKWDFWLNDPWNKKDGIFATVTMILCCSPKSPWPITAQYQQPYHLIF